jgi:hypothetical protein
LTFTSYPLFFSCPFTLLIASRAMTIFSIFISC